VSEVADLLARIVAELAERGIRPTPLNVIAHAVDIGVDNGLMVELARLLRQQQHVSRAA
jgi:hypothetical protein